MVLLPLEQSRIATLQNFPVAQSAKGTIDAVLLNKVLAAPIFVSEDDAVSRSRGANPLPTATYAPFAALLENLSGLDLSRMEMALQYFAGLTPKTQPDVAGIIDPAQVLAQIFSSQKAYTFSTTVLNAISDALGVFNVGAGATSLSVGAADAVGPIGYVYNISQADINLPTREVSLSLTTSVGALLAEWSYNLPSVLNNGAIFCWAAGRAERRVAALTPAAAAPFGGFLLNSDVSETYTVSNTSNVFQVLPAPGGDRWVLRGANLNVDIVPIDYTRETLYALYAALSARRLDLFPIWAMSKFGRVAF